MTQERYPIYKGLQKPLIYRGFKGKFIYWGIGSLIGGLALGGLVGALTNLFLGGFATLALMGAGLAYTFMKQGNGLHDKTRHRGVFIHPIHLSIRYEVREKVNF
ncbi:MULTISPECIES: DUF4133 domain-containing protein [Parapedobacter]|uniref:DUF4133 domain-containing protein n=1 Tax=Parapedobacter indicus TaxID=1477437 RepID=A0A1I3DTF0_9SPHI|nr:MULTISPECIES: DUF4133 domain-containing protein [Parapedobacter]MEC3879098.1 DUF4133 domain-containing protein [Parapedobacter sp. 10938]PPL04830.1 hypothetical protein CLV26_101638 [Parapedobacter indicus]SFH89829.1 hypothetical protein SAMN05444682_101624 [Parapedobacter indicus]